MKTRQNLYYFLHFPEKILDTSIKKTFLEAYKVLANEPWHAGWLSNGQNFSVKFAKTRDKQILKILRRYPDLCLSYGEMT